MTSDRCELIKAFATDPRGQAERVREHLHDILAHVDACDECETILDEATDAEAIFEVLADEGAHMSAAERQALDRWTTPDTTRKAEVHKAVIELIKGLRPEAARIAGKFDSDILHAATEAVSLAIRRSIGRAPASPPWIVLFRDGTVSVDGEEAISAEGLAAEIAVFTNHWATSAAGSERPSPSGEARLLADWTFLALRDQRHLLRHFRALPPVFGLPLMSENSVMLMPLRREERIDNLFERWRPDTLQGLDTLYIGRRATGRPTSGYEIIAVAAVHVAEGIRDEAVVRTLRELGLGPHAEVFLGSQAPPEPDAPPTQGPRLLGFFDAVTFSGRRVELTTPGRPLRLRAERIVWRWDDLGV